MSLEKESHKNGELTVVTLKGDLEVSVADDFIEYVRELCEEGHRHFFINLSEVQTIDSSGLGSFIRVLPSIRRLDGSMHLQRPNDRVFRVFEMTRLDGFFDFVDTEEEAKELAKIS